MKINVLTFRHRFVESEIPDDFEFLRVTLMSGDEIIEVYCADPDWRDPYLYETLDPESASRTRNFLDATYIVRPDQMEAWNKRQPSYHIFEKDEFKATFDGYFGM